MNFYPSNTPNHYYIQSVLKNNNCPELAWLTYDDNDCSPIQYITTTNFASAKPWLFEEKINAFPNSPIQC